MSRTSKRERHGNLYVVGGIRLQMMWLVFRVSDYTKRSLESLFKDLEKYPTFGTKILSIMDRSNENKASCHITSERFYKMLCAFPFIKKVYFNRRSMEMLRDYLIFGGSQQTSLMNLEEVHSLEPSYKRDMVSYVFCLQVCYLLRSSITSLNIRMKPGGPVEVALNEDYGGVPAYISNFPNLTQLGIEGHYTKGNNHIGPLKFDVMSVIENANPKLKELKFHDRHWYYRISEDNGGSTDLDTYRGNTSSKKLLLDVCWELSPTTLKYITIKISGLESLHVSVGSITNDEKFTDELQELYDGGALKDAAISIKNKSGEPRMYFYLPRR